MKSLFRTYGSLGILVAAVSDSPPSGVLLAQRQSCEASMQVWILADEDAQCIAVLNHQAGDCLSLEFLADEPGAPRNGHWSVGGFFLEW